MITQEEALATILRHVHPLRPRIVPLRRADRCFAAQEVTARLALPGFDNSAMDGYAVVASATGAEARLKVIGEQPAGLDRQLQVQAGEAVRIFTGAPLPRGADAVVMQEETTVEGDAVVLQTAAEPGEFVRRRGGDVAEGQKLLAQGERIRPQMLALLAAQGFTGVQVGGNAHVAILSTGDELAEPGTPLQPGQIYESNSLALRALVERTGAEVVSCVHCPDQAGAIETSLRAAFSCDVVIVSGGVSVGAHDLVKAALGHLGATLDLWRVALKPGRPFLFGRLGECLVFGLPGNPVSAFVTFLLFVRPALLKLMGAGDDALGLEHAEAHVTERLTNEGERPHYLRGVLHDGKFTTAGRQESHALFGLSRSNALLLLGPGETLEAGGVGQVFTWP